MNIIDRLLFERDSQFSNFNSKIDRLRHGGNSMTSLKEHRKSSHNNYHQQPHHLLNETGISYHSN